MAEQKTLDIVNGLNIETLKKAAKTFQDEPEMAQCKFHVHNDWLGSAHNRTTISTYYGSGHENPHKQIFNLDADEPPVLAGEDEGANPVEHLLNALAACLTTSMVSHAAMHGIRIDELQSEVEGDIDLRGFMGLSSDVRKGYQKILVKFKVKTDEENLDKLKKLTLFSPVYDVVTHGTDVEIQLERK